MNYDVKQSPIIDDRVQLGQATVIDFTCHLK